MASLSLSQHVGDEAPKGLEDNPSMPIWLNGLGDHSWMDTQRVEELCIAPDYEGPLPASLRVLQIASMGFREDPLPDGLHNLSGLRELELQVCSQEGLPAGVSDIPQLERLALLSGKCKLPETLTSLSNLKVLEVPYSYGLLPFPTFVWQMESLTKLDLSSVNCEEIPECVTKLQALRSLSLATLEELTLPAHLSQLTNLEELCVRIGSVRGLRAISSMSLRVLDVTQMSADDDLSELTRVEELTVIVTEEAGFMALCKLTQLKNLVVGVPSMRVLPPDIQNLSNLTSLTLRKAYHLGDADAVLHLVNLEYLSLAEARAPLPRGFEKLVHLRDIHASQAPSEIPPTISNLTQLRLLAVSAESLPDELGDCGTLETLDVGGVESMPDTLGMLTNLRILSLDDCELSQLPDSFCELASLEELSIYGCGKLRLPEGISRLTSLKSLDMEGAEDGFSLPSSLPPNLRRLCLTSMGHAELPPSVSCLTQLYEVSLLNMTIKVFPTALPGICYLTFERCELLPVALSSIGRLTSLSRLEMKVNHLAELPSGISHLTRLRSLTFIDESASITGSLGGLTHLHALSAIVKEAPSLTEWLPQMTCLKALAVTVSSEASPIVLPPSVFLLPKLGSLQAERASDDFRELEADYGSDYEYYLDHENYME